MTYTTSLRFFLVLAILAASITPVFAQSATAAANAGDLVRCPDYSAVYYLAEDNQRYVFPNEGTFGSYYTNFNDVKWISCAALSDLPIGGNVPYRAGMRLLKMPSVPTTYAVEPGGVLRAIPNEEKAQEMYGEYWNLFVDDLSEAFFPTYELGTPLAEDELPQGMITANLDAEKVYVVWENDEIVELDSAIVDESMTIAIFYGLQEQNRYQHRYQYRSANQGEISQYQQQTRPANVDEEDVVTFEDIRELTDNEIWYADEHVQGNLETAQVVMIEYVDFECFFSAAHHATMQQIMNDYGDDVAWIIRHFPLSFHVKAERAALASECAAEQGKFWEYAEGLFEEQSNFDDLVFIDLAQDLGLNSDRFIACYIGDEYQQEVDADIAEAVASGVTGTPYTFINDELVAGALPYESFKTIIDQELAE